MRKITRRLVLTVALALPLALTACAPAAHTIVEPASVDPGSPETSGEAAPEPPAEQEACPAGVIAGFDYNGPNMEVDISVIEAALGADFPGGVGCAVLTPGDTDGHTYFYIFWPGQDQNFADTIANTLIAAGATPQGEPIWYSKGGADIEVRAYPAGDDSAGFDGAPSLVIGKGNIPDTGHFG